MSSASINPLTPEQEAALRESLKRCSNETIEAAIAFRNEGRLDQAPVVIIGIIERFCEPEIRSKLKESNADALHVAEDLGIDSLTMVDVVMHVEEALDITIDNEELADLRTIGDVKTFVKCKLTGETAPGRHEIVWDGLANDGSSLPDGAKWLLAAGMLLGRLEFLSVLVLFTPVFWAR